MKKERNKQNEERKKEGKYAKSEFNCRQDQQNNKKVKLKAKL